MYKVRFTNSKGIVKVVGASDDIKVMRQLCKNVVDSVKSLNELYGEERWVKLNGDSVSVISDEGAKKVTYEIVEEPMLRQGERYMTMSMVTKRA